MIILWWYWKLIAIPTQSICLQKGTWKASFENIYIFDGRENWTGLENSQAHPFEHLYPELKTIVICINCN